MEGVEGLLGKLRLTEDEKGGVKIGGEGSRRKKAMEPQAVGKVLAEKLMMPETLERTLGRIRCQIKGVVCKDMGENHFHFTFLQASGKWRALEDGPWMILKDLVVMADFDESKTLEETEFNQIPIWVRVSNLSFGMMNRETGVALGKKIGVFREADVGEDGTVVGRVLRIKVVIDIRKPLMRGIIIKVGSPEKEKWCPLAYEYLSDFCYNYDIIGHVEKQCPKPCDKGEPQQFSRSLRFIPEKNPRSRSTASYGGQGSRGSGSGGRWGSSGSGSDALTWKKSEEGRSSEKGEEVTSPLKIGATKEQEKIKRGAPEAKRSLQLLKDTAVHTENQPGGRVADAKKGAGSKQGKRGYYKKVERVITRKEEEGGSEKSGMNLFDPSTRNTALNPYS